MSTEKQARITDMVRITCAHGKPIGHIVSGSQYSYVDRLKQARVSDKVICSKCGCEGHIITGSEYTFVDNLRAARVTDMEVGKCSPGCKKCPHSRTGKIIQGSMYTYTT